MVIFHIQLWSRWIPNWCYSNFLCQNVLCPDISFYYLNELNTRWQTNPKLNNRLRGFLLELPNHSSIPPPPPPKKKELYNHSLVCLYVRVCGGICWPCSSRWPFFAVKILADGKLWSNLLMFLLNYSDILVKRGYRSHGLIIVHCRFKRMQRLLQLIKFPTRFVFFKVKVCEKQRTWYINR